MIQLKYYIINIMAHCINQQLTQLEGKVPIKNLHTVRDLQLYNNKEILIVFDYVVHFHSIDKMISSLPSLVYVLELPLIVSKIESENYQDNLTKKILSSNKSNFGQIIFTQDLNPDKNVLVSVTHLRDRLKYLGSQFIKIKSLNIHQCGHLLINFEDGRCVLLKRTTPINLNERYQRLYKVQEPVLLNNILKSSIASSIFISTQQISFVCFHNCSQKQSSPSTLSRITYNEKAVPTIFSVSSKRPNLQTKGFMGIEHVGIKNQSEWIILVYYNRLQVIELGKANYKNKSFQVLGHKEADFSEELAGQHAIKMWKYQLYNKDEQKMVRFYCLTSSSIWELDINFKAESNNHFSWNYTFSKSEGQLIATKSNIFYINHKGNYLQYNLDRQGHPNFTLNLAAETDNGLLVRLQANGGNYKQGFLYIVCPNANYIVEKMIKNLMQKLYGDRCWVNFDDLKCLQNSPNLRKEILKQMTQINKSNKKQENADDDQSVIVNKLIINVLTLFKSKPEIVQNLINKSIVSQLKLSSRQSYRSNCCMMTNRRITVEEVLACDRCHLYCIKEAGKGSVSCYICWNPLFQIS